MTYNLISWRKRLFGVGLLLSLMPVAFADITGTVFRDFNANGVHETDAAYHEPGVGGITVSCVDGAGNNGTAVTSSASATLGQYTLTGCSGAARVEFSGFLAGDYAGAVGSGNQTSVQFVNAPVANVDFAISLLGDYYGPGSNTLPDIATSIMTNGDQSSGTVKSLVSLPYDASAPWEGDVQQQALDTDTGSIYGIAYKKDTNQIFSSAYLKRHVGLGPGGLDAIYVTTRGSNDTKVFVRLQADLGINVGSIGSNASRGLGALADPSHDVDAFNNIGEAGIGDIDISVDGKTLYVTNLYDKKLYAIKIDADNNPATKPVAADVTAYTIPTPAACNATTRTAIRVNMSGPRYVQTDGTVWMPGSYSYGGQDGVTTDTIDVSAPGAADETIYKTWRDYVSGVHVPLQNGTYTVKLHFADFWGGAAPDGRNFDINFENGQLVENAFNIYEAAGGNGKAVVKTYAVTVNDNQLDIDFTAIKGSVMLSAMEVIGNTDVQAGNWRPFAIGTESDSVFVGGVCDAMNSQNPADLKATVYRLNTGTGAFTEVLDVPLDYQKGYAYGGSCAGQNGWFGWLPDNVFPPLCDTGGSLMIYPQPILTDIDFAADRSMLLGFRDRLGDQVGQENYPLSGTTLVNGVSAGDLLRAARNGDVYQLESNGSVAGLTSAGADNHEGPGGGEFYYLDNFGSGHQESSMGSLASHKGFDQLLYNRIDLDTIKTGGIAWLSNLDAQQAHAYNLYNQSAYFMGKSSGLGDMELLLATVPSEIGNRVWLDTNKNGIQDADESGIPGVQVQLLSGSTVLATATTDTDGTYYFSNGNGTSTASRIYGVTELQPGGSYTLQFPTTVMVAGTDYLLTTALEGGDPLLDSNALATGEVTVAVTDLPAPGANNHSFDVGYAASKIDLSLVKTADKTSSRRGDTVVYTLTVSNSGPDEATGVTVNDDLPSDLVHVSNTPSSGTYDPVSGIWTVGSIPAGGNATLTITVKVK